MIEIIGAFLSILAALLPMILAHAAERKPIKARGKIDELLLTGTPVDVAAELSQLHDEATGDSAGQSATNVHIGGAGSV